ncbi:MAG: CHASE2 domain-containing protein [Usitatibacter sp.]
METHDDGGRTAMRAVAVAALALCGFLISLLPASTSLDLALLDAQWQVLRRFDWRPAPDEIVIVGVDEATVKAIAEPPGLWHVPLGRALARLASAKPRAMVLELALPERSFDSVKPGLDRALFDGLATAVESGPFVAALSIDPRTRAARNIHKPFLALLGESRLGLNLVARDADGMSRRFSLVVPTEDGGFPTLEGRLCRALNRVCVDGLIDYSLGKPFTYVPLKNVLAMTDNKLFDNLFRDRIVLIGETLPYTDRIDVPVNFAGWEPGGRDSPAIVVHAQTLRTALSGEAPRESARPLALLLVSIAALVFLLRNAKLAALLAAVLGLVLFAAAVLALRQGMHLTIAPVLATLAVAVAARAAVAFKERPKP